MIGFRSLSCEPGQQTICIDPAADTKALAVVEPDVVLVPTSRASLAAEEAPDEAAERRCALTIEANCELDRTVAADEMRGFIARDDEELAECRETFRSLTQGSSYMAQGNCLKNL